MMEEMLAAAALKKGNAKKKGEEVEEELVEEGEPDEAEALTALGAAGKVARTPQLEASISSATKVWAR